MPTHTFLQEPDNLRELERIAERWKHYRGKCLARLGAKPINEEPVEIPVNGFFSISGTNQIIGAFPDVDDAVMFNASSEEIEFVLKFVRELQEANRLLATG